MVRGAEVAEMQRTRMPASAALGGCWSAPLTTHGGSGPSDSHCKIVLRDVRELLARQAEIRVTNHLQRLRRI